MVIIPDEVWIRNFYKRNIYTNTHLHLSGKKVLRRSRELTWKCYSYPAKIYLFKVNNRNTIDVGDVVQVFYCKLWTYFTLFSSVSIFVFEQVNVSGALDIKGYFKALSNIFHPHMIQYLNANGNYILWVQLKSEKFQMLLFSFLYQMLKDFYCRSRFKNLRPLSQQHIVEEVSWNLREFLRF